MKKTIWSKVVIGFIALYALGVIISQNEEPVSEHEESVITAVTETEETVVVTAEVTEQEETTNAERVGVSENELQEIIKVIGDYNHINECNYDREDVDLVRKDNDTLVDFEEYIVFMKDGEVIHLSLNKSLLK